MSSVSLEEEYRKDVERVGQSLEKVISRRKASRFKKILDSILPVALLSLTFVVLFGFFVPVTETMKVYISYLNWAVILYFAARLAVELRLSKHREQFVQNHLLDFLLVIPAFSVLREVKLLSALGEIDLLDEEAAMSVAFTKEASLAGQMTRITRIVKRSIGF